MFKRLYISLFFLLFIVLFFIGNSFSSVSSSSKNNKIVSPSQKLLTAITAYTIAKTASNNCAQSTTTCSKSESKSKSKEFKTANSNLNKLVFSSSVSTISSLPVADQKIIINGFISTYNGNLNPLLSSLSVSVISSFSVTNQKNIITRFISTYTKAKKKFKSCTSPTTSCSKSESKKFTIIKDNLNKLLSSLSVNSEYLVITALPVADQKILLTELNNNNCKNSIFPSICNFYLNQNLASLVATSFGASIENNKSLQIIKETNFINYNMAIFNKVENFVVESKSKFNFTTFCTGSSISQACVTAIKTFCSKKSTPDNCKNLVAIAKKAYQETAIDSSFGLNSIILGALNPDQSAIQAAALFGFKANYSNVPGWLKEDSPSLICQAKIRGYLNVVKQTSFGTTQYKCQNGTVTNTSCIPSIVGNLKAQRTKITPNNTTTITYSYYIKAPLQQNLLYSIGIAYKEGSNEIVKLIIGNSTDRRILKAGQVISFQDFINFPVENISFINKNSFEIGLLAVYNNSKQIYYHITSPIVLINYGSYYKGLYQIGNNNNYSNNLQNTGLSDSNMKDMMFG